LPQATSRRIDFIFFNAGGGHRSAANALKAVIEEQRRPWEVRLVNLQELLDPLDVFRKITGLRLEDVYNTLLQRGWTWGSRPMLRIMHGVLRFYYSGQVKILGEFWKRDTPDLVVSLVPNFNRALLNGLRACSATAPFVTILTDFADYPPHFWIERQEQYLICGTERAVQQARALGHAEVRIFRTSGMILRPSFYETPAEDTRAARERLGLKPDLPTGLVLFGGEGSKKMLDIARQVRKMGARLQLIFICGRNGRLKARLDSMETPYPKFVEGFTKEIPRYMAMSDFFIGKPGPGSISEALAMKLPVIVERNSWTLVQERYNADWVREKQVGLVVPSFSQIGGTLEAFLAPEAFSRFRANAAAIHNRAVFEIPEILEKLLG
jgi:1,2-diacylglycerol 3-beta-galactosyltransferase